MKNSSNSLLTGVKKVVIVNKMFVPDDSYGEVLFVYIHIIQKALNHTLRKNA